MKREMRKLLTLQILRVLLVDERGKIASIVENHVQGLSTRESRQGLLNAPGVLLFRLAFPREDRNAGRCDPERLQDKRNQLLFPQVRV